MLGSRRQRSRLAASQRPERRGVVATARRWMIPAIGAATPIMLIVVNIAVFIVRHLAQFRWTIAVLAFVSGIMLNSWAGLNVYRMLRRRRPNHPWLQEGNQEVALIVGMLIVILASFASGFFVYQGLGDEKNLPNQLTFFTGVISIAIPILLQAFFRHNVTREEPADPALGNSGGLARPPDTGGR